MEPNDLLPLKLISDIEKLITIFVYLYDNLILFNYSDFQLN